MSEMAEGERAGVSDEQTAVARAVIYRFLSRCFSHPDRELIELIDSARLEEFLLSWRYLGSAASENVAKAVEWLAGRPSREDALLELQKEYTRLFITGYPQVVAPPYSSVYLGNQRTVWGQSTAEVAKLYEAAGLGISEEFHDIPDHIAAELEFASYLIVEQQRQLESDPDNAQKLLDIERKFLIEHLSQWAPVFFSRVAECSRLPFYSEIARFAQRFIQADASHTA
jgi:DMSO reductase family type II enzyme chaperone